MIKSKIYSNFYLKNIMLQNSTNLQKLAEIYFEI